MRLLKAYKSLAVQDLTIDPEFMADMQAKRQQLEGFQVGDMECRQTLGTGSFGHVKLCKHKETGNVYAIKMISKAVVVKTKQIAHIQAEKEILASISHPFIINLYGVSQDDKNLYLALEFSQGGELFTHLRKAVRFSNDTSMYYAASVVLIFEYLHNQHIIYRDLKPENLLLDHSGKLKMCDFGFAKTVEPGTNTWTLCGTPEYLAPEVILNKGHGKAVDWWTFGILLFEMLAGFPPFHADDRMALYKSILVGKIEYPKHFKNAAKDLVSNILTQDLSVRLGNLKNGTKDIKKHPYFHSMDWKALAQGKLDGPIKISTAGADDASNFEQYSDDVEGPGDKMGKVDRKDQAKFEGFDSMAVAPPTPIGSPVRSAQKLQPPSPSVAPVGPKSPKAVKKSLSARFASRFL